MIDYEDRITVVQGDATSADDIAKIIDKVDVLVHCVSVPLQHEKPTHLYSQTTQAIIDARPHGSAKQLIVMSSAGLGMDASFLDQPIWSMKRCLEMLQMTRKKKKNCYKSHHFHERLSNHRF